MTTIKPRYQVRQWQLDGTTMHCVWDTELNERAATPLWITERYAQEDADKLNVAGGGEQNND